MDKLKYKIASPMLMWAIVVVGGVILWNLVMPNRFFESGVAGIILLGLGFINWVYVLYKSNSVHKQAPTSVHNIDQLVKEGTYAVVRHPIYAADIVLAWCVFILYPTSHILAVVAWLCVVLVFWANFEERMLEEKFMDDYREYKKRVPMFIPRFRRNK